MSWTPIATGRPMRYVATLVSKFDRVHESHHATVVDSHRRDRHRRHDIWSDRGSSRARQLRHRWRHRRRHRRRRRRAGDRGRRRRWRHARCSPDADDAVSQASASERVSDRVNYRTFPRQDFFFTYVHWTYLRMACKKNVEPVTDHTECHCRNYGRNLVSYVATINYLSRHLFVILV